MFGIDNSFEFIFLVGFVVGSIIRKIFTFRCRHGKAVRKHKDIVDITLISAAGIGMVLPFFFIFTPLLDFADYRLPAWLRWIGTAVFAMALLLLWRSHADLGSNWSAILQIKQEHILVTDGIYRHIRHPMYAAHIYWALGQAAILPNWIAGFSFIVIAGIHLTSRINDEEAMMVGQFGEEYIKYRKSTGYIFPKITLK